MLTAVIHYVMGLRTASAFLLCSMLAMSATGQTNIYVDDDAPPVAMAHPGAARSLICNWRWRRRSSAM